MRAIGGLHEGQSVLRDCVVCIISLSPSAIFVIDGCLKFSLKSFPNLLYG